MTHELDGEENFASSRETHDVGVVFLTVSVMVTP